MKAVILTRVSTKHQEESGLGLQAQLNSCLGWCERNGVSDYVVFQEAGVSGALPVDKRDVLVTALSELQAGDVLLVAKLDRVSREMLTMAIVRQMLEKKGARLVSADGVADGETPEAQMMAMIMTCFAVYERLCAKSRTKAALQAKKAQGKRYTNHAPYGFTFKDGELVPAPQEARLVEMVKDLRNDGLSFAKISARVNAAGFTNRRGNQFQAMTISNILKAA